MCVKSSELYLATMTVLLPPCSSSYGDLYNSSYSLLYNKLFGSWAFEALDEGESVTIGKGAKVDCAEVIRAG